MMDILKEYSDSRSNSTDQEDHNGYDVLKKKLNSSLGFVDLGRITYGRIGEFIVLFCIVITQLGFCIGYGVFVGNVAYGIFFSDSTDSSDSSLKAVQQVSFSLAAFNSSEPSSVEQLNDTLAWPVTTESVLKETVQSKNDAALVLMVLCVSPIFVALTLFRNVRQMGIISILANFAICVGLVCVLTYITTSKSASKNRWDDFRPGKNYNLPSLFCRF